MKPIYRAVYLLAKGFFRLFFKLRVYGIEHFKPGAALVAANHASFYDPPVLSVSCPEEVHFLAKSSLFSIPLFGSFIRALNAHPVTRGASDTQTFRNMVELLSKGKKLIIFPEGKRSDDGDLLPFERGFAFLVQKSGCQVLPAYIDGSFEAWPPSRKWPKMFGKISVVFGSAVRWDFHLGKKEAQEKIIKDVEDAVRSLKKWLESGAVGTPP